MQASKVVKVMKLMNFLGDALSPTLALTPLPATHFVGTRPVGAGRGGGGGGQRGGRGTPT